MTSLNPSGKPRAKNRRTLSPLARRVLSEAVRDPDRTLREIGIAAGLPADEKVSLRVGRALRQKNTQEIMREMMERTPGLKRVDLLGKLKDGLDATLVARFAHLGKVKTEKVDVDFSTRGRYLDLAFRVNGATNYQRVELTGPAGAPLIPEALGKVLDAMREEDLKLLITKLLVE